MNEIYYWVHNLTGILVLIVRFLFHWVGQLVSLVNWDFAVSMGLRTGGDFHDMGPFYPHPSWPVSGNTSTGVELGQTVTHRTE